MADDLEKYLMNNKIEYQKDYIKMPAYGGKNRTEQLFIIGD